MVLLQCIMENTITSLPIEILLLYRVFDCFSDVSKIIIFNFMFLHCSVASHDVINAKQVQCY